MFFVRDFEPITDTGEDASAVFGIEQGVTQPGAKQVTRTGFARALKTSCRLR